MSYLSTVEVFNTFPQEIKNKVINTMGAYSEVSVKRENGVLSVGTCSCISKYYAPDHKVWYFDKKELKKQYAKEIEAKELRYYEECKDCDWEAFCN